MNVNGLSFLLIAACVVAVFVWREAERDVKQLRYANRVLRRQQSERDLTIQALCAANRELTAQRDETQDVLNMLCAPTNHPAHRDDSNVIDLPVKAGK